MQKTVTQNFKINLVEIIEEVLQMVLELQILTPFPTLKQIQ